MTNPDPAQRPKLVTWAYRCWVIGGAVLIVVGITYIVLGIVLSDVATAEPVGIGLIVTIVGIAYILMGSKAFVGDIRWRSSLAALTLVVVAMLLVLSVLASFLAFALLGGVIGILGSLLAYRPESETWYTGEAPPERKPLFGKGRKDK